MKTVEHRLRQQIDNLERPSFKERLVFLLSGTSRRDRLVEAKEKLTVYTNVWDFGFTLLSPLIRVGPGSIYPPQERPTEQDYFSYLSKLTKYPDLVEGYLSELVKQSQENERPVFGLTLEAYEARGIITAIIERYQNAGVHRGEENNTGIPYDIYRQLGKCLRDASVIPNDFITSIREKYII